MRQSCPEELILMRSAPNTCDLNTNISLYESSCQVDEGHITCSSRMPKREFQLQHHKTGKFSSEDVCNFLRRECPVPFSAK
mmetsp:Transcript_65532/g.156637  ORF Transcript_65532/g.156637 Transcript_65532/m.156637 type:complete len:81 (-) Transcript_65532:1902-2144(-)